MLKKKVFLGLLLGASSFALQAAIPTTYQNTYISYDSPAYLNSLLQYTSDQKIGGVLMWEVTGDLPITSQDSLLYQVVNTKVTAPPGIVQLFWPDWSAERNYGDDGLPVWGNGGTSKYQDNLDGQGIQDQIVALANSNKTVVLTYSFMETNTDGSLKAFDPWSDLSPQDSKWCANAGNFCGGTPTADTSYFGSIVKLLQLKNSATYAVKPKILPKVILSVGGWNHDADVENAIKNPAAFVQSYSKLNAALQNQNLPVFDGVDFDYEKADQATLATDFGGLINLIIAFHTANPTAYISVDLMGNDQFLSNIKSDLMTLINQVPGARLNIMSYDFHGAFDYDPKNPADSKTGLLSRLYADPKNPGDFSIEKEIAALQGINPNNISLGFAAYGRTLSNITPNQSSLYQGQITTASWIPIQYDLDDHGPDFSVQGQARFRCAVSFDNPAYTYCDGMYPWSYIHDMMLKNGFTEHVVTNSNGLTSGVYAENQSTWQPEPPKDYSGGLKIQILASQYYYSFLKITADDQKSIQVGPPLSANAAYNTNFQATSNENQLTFKFCLDATCAAPVNCVAAIPKNGDGSVDTDKQLQVTRSGSPYNGSAKCTVSVQ